MNVFSHCFNHFQSSFSFNTRLIIIAHVLFQTTNLPFWTDFISRSADYFIVDVRLCFKCLHVDEEHTTATPTAATPILLLWIYFRVPLVYKEYETTAIPNGDELSILGCLRVQWKYNLGKQNLKWIRISQLVRSCFFNELQTGIFLLSFRVQQYIYTKRK